VAVTGAGSGKLTVTLGGETLVDITPPTMTLEFDATTGALLSRQDTLAKEGFYIQDSIGANFDLTVSDTSNKLVITLNTTGDATGTKAEFKLEGVNLNGKVTVKNDDDGGSDLLAKALVDAGFDFSDVAAGGHEISFRVPKRGNCSALCHRHPERRGHETE
jgi:hypothetical protein